MLSAEEVGVWEGLELQRTLMGMQDVVTCPRCDTYCIEVLPPQNPQNSPLFVWKDLVAREEVLALTGTCKAPSESYAVLRPSRIDRPSQCSCEGCIILHQT